MNQQIRNFISKARILFVTDGCIRCQKWKEFIEKLNIEVPIEKRIKVITCTNYNSLGIVDYPVIKLFDKYMEGNFPFLFFEGVQLNGANSRIEVEAFIKGALNNDFIIKRNNPYMFNEECKYLNKGLLNKKTLVCQE